MVETRHSWAAKGLARKIEREAADLEQLEREAGTAKTRRRKGWRDDCAALVERLGLK